MRGEQKINMHYHSLNSQCHIDYIQHCHGIDIRLLIIIYDKRWKDFNSLQETGTYVIIFFILPIIFTIYDKRWKDFNS